MEIITAIVTPVVETLMVPVKRHIGYVIFTTKYVRDMGTKMRQLEAKKDDVENHVNRNKSNNLEVPSEVRIWLEEVVKIDAQVGSIPTDVSSCLNLKLRHKLGRKSFKISEEITRVIEENGIISWTDRPIPLGKVGSMKASTSTPSPTSHHSDFESREQTFMEALKALQPESKCQMIALCGMGGIGKTTMMEKLKNVVEENKLFNMIVKVVVGEKTNTIAIQDAVADYLGLNLTEKSESARSDRLRKSFESHSNEGKNKILVILDDVWQIVHLNDVGLSPLPNQGVGFKFLLTSRDQCVCTMMGVEANLIFNLDFIKEQEAHSFFQQFAQVPSNDHDLQKIGANIVRKCYGLPIAIRTVAVTLKYQSKDAWKDALSRLENHDINGVMHQIFEMSYKNLIDDETRSIFLLCGLYLEDSDIPREDLVRYGWGLELFNKVYSIRHARNRLNTCIDRIIHANLLIQAQDIECVKMHDLVRSFVLDKCSEGDHTSIVGDASKCPMELKSKSYNRISLTCTNMVEFPINFKFPNLSFFKLMHGNELLDFPEDFYEEMKKLQVLAYEKMKYPLFFRSLQCSSNLRTLCLHECTLVFDCSSIGDLLNLEVLSFIRCRIQKLPSTIGNLKQLKLLQFTCCDDLCLDEGILKNFVKLEELYIRIPKSIRDRGVSKEPIGLTNGYRDELIKCSENLTSLEFEFSDNNDLPKNFSFEKLERFKISLGCYLEEKDGHDKHSFRNTLMLVAKKSKLLDSKINELFEKTELLHLEVDDISHVGEVLVASLYDHRSSFYMLRALKINGCANLRYLFTVDMANSLMKLEHLDISSCPVLKAVIDGKDGGDKVIQLQVLKFLSLKELPDLTSLCNDVNAIELSQLEELILESLPNFTSIFADNKSSVISAAQPLLNKKVAISQLKKLVITNMEKLKDIWPGQLRNNEDANFPTLREIIVKRCDNLVNLFPCNPMSLLCHLKDLDVRNCGSINVIFNIDLGRVGEVEENNICLRKIYLYELRNLREVWRIKGANNSQLLRCCGFRVVEELEILTCMKFRNTVSFRPLLTNDGGESGRNNEIIKRNYPKQEIKLTSDENIKKACGGSDFDDVVPSSLFFNHIHEIKINHCKEVDVMFEIGSDSSREVETCQTDTTQEQLTELTLWNMEHMSHVWKCNWNKLLIHQPQYFSPFHNITTISLGACDNIKYLFSPLMAKHLSSLKKINIRNCGVIEEVVSNRDDGEMATSIISTNSFLHLDILNLDKLSNLKSIGGGSTNMSFDQFKISQVDVCWSLCQYLKEIHIDACDALSNVIPSYAVGHMQKLETMEIRHCESLVEVFETVVIPRQKTINVPKLSNLKVLWIIDCHSLQYVFTFSTLESLVKLEKIRIQDCKEMKVIVKEENEEQIPTSKVVVFPCMKSIELFDLPKLACFFLGMNEFQCSLLDYVDIWKCPLMRMFISGRLIAPKLDYIRTDLGKHSLEGGFDIFQFQAFQTSFSSLGDTNSEGLHLSFHSLIEMHVEQDCHVKKIIPSTELLQLKNLEKIYVSKCGLLEEVFEVLETETNINSTSVVLKIPKLREVRLESLKSLKYIWKKNPWMILEFPNLTKVYIHGCGSLEHVFTSSMVASLLQLQDLHISQCQKLDVVVKKEEKEEECDNGKMDEIVIVLPNLKSLCLDGLTNLKGFYLGKESFSWPLLDTMEIRFCPAMTIFTKEHVAASKLKVINTNHGKTYITRDSHSFIRHLYSQRNEDGIKCEININSFVGTITLH